MNQIKTQIDALDLTDAERNPVQVRKFPWDNSHIYRGITVHLPTREYELPGTNGCDDIVYPIMVTIVVGVGGAETTSITRIATWREKIRREFINQRLTGVTSVYTCRIKFGSVLLPDKYRKNYDATTMAILCVSREQRGN